MRINQLVCLSIVATVALACASKRNDMGLEECGPGGMCPTGFECHESDNLCYLIGSTDSDARPADARMLDARPAPDAVVPDARLLDAAPAPDVRPTDAAVMPDARSVDARPADARPIDAVPIDAPPNQPVTSLDAMPPAFANSATAQFSFSSNIGASTFMCKVDDAAFAACTNGVTVGPLSDGMHTFQVYAVSPQGAADASPAMYMWTVDTMAPVTTLAAGGPTGTVSATDATFMFSSSEAGTFQCKLDSAAYAACTSPQSYSGLANGMHTFLVRAVDLAKNTDPSPPSRTWNVNSDSPRTFVDSGPANPTNINTTATFTFSASKPNVTFDCNLDSAGYAPCTSPKTYNTTFADGAHSFEARATDDGGQMSSGLWQWTVDTTGPVVTITSGPAAGDTSGTTVTFTYSSLEDDVSFECSLDGQPAASCPPSGMTYTGLADGAHSFAVYGLDSPLLNQGADDSVSWTVDAVGPTVTISSPTAGQRTAPAGTILFSSEAGATAFMCKLDGAANYSACDPANGLAFSGLADGAHSVAIHATDALGNVGSDASVSWTVDATGPTVIITDTGGSGKAFALSYHSTSTDVAGYFCRVDGDDFAACEAGAHTFSELSPGAHDFDVYAVDDLGNQGPTATLGTEVNVGPGHAVLIGNDYKGYVKGATTADPLAEIIANAVAKITPIENSDNKYERKIRVLVLIGASVDASEQKNTEAALADGVDYLKLAGFALTEKRFDGGVTGVEFDKVLRGYDVILVPDQQNASVMTTVGGAWKSQLTSFVNNGGVIVVCDGLDAANKNPSQTFQLFTASDVMRISDSVPVNVDETVAVPDKSEPVSPPDYGRYVTRANTVAFLLTDQYAVIVVHSPISTDSKYQFVVAHSTSFPHD